MGKEQERRSSAPEKTSNSRGVTSRKLSRLTRTISTSGRPQKSPSRWRAVATPPIPPPRIRIRFFDAEAFIWIRSPLSELLSAAVLPPSGPHGGLLRVDQPQSIGLGSVGSECITIL